VLQENWTLEKFSISTNKISENLSGFTILHNLSMDIGTASACGLAIGSTATAVFYHASPCTHRPIKDIIAKIKGD